MGHLWKVEILDPAAIMQVGVKCCLIHRHKFGGYQYSISREIKRAIDQMED